MILANTKRAVFIITLAIIIYISLLLYFDLNNIINAIKNFKYFYIILIMFTLLIAQFFMFLRWIYLLHIVRIKIPLQNRILIYLSSWAVFFFPAKTGELIKSFFLKKLHNVPYKSSIPVIFVEQLTDLTAILLFSFLGFHLLNFFDNIVPIIFIVLTLLVLGVILISNKKIVSMLLKMLSRLPFIKKYGDETDQILNTIRLLLKPKNFIVSVLLGAGYWFFSSVILFFILLGFMNPLPITSVVFIFPFSTLVGFISTIPGGIGTMEGSVLMILISQNISNSIIAITIILLRLFTLWIPSIAGIYALFNINKKISLNNK